MIRLLRACAVVGVCALLIPLSAVAAPMDTFTSGFEGWHVGGAQGGPNPFPPMVIGTGGPGGVDDAYLQISSGPNTGGPAGTRLAVMNASQWGMNYTAAGISAISMDVNNLGTSDLYLRLLFEDFEGPPGPPVNLALTTDAIFVPAGSGWVNITFPILPSDLTALFGTSVDLSLSSADVLRIFHNPDPTFFGPPNAIPQITATLGIDNIQAIPEPSTVLLVAAGLTMAGLRMRRARTLDR